MKTLVLQALFQYTKFRETGDFMRNPNGYGTVYKLSGKRRKPYIARKTVGWADDGKQIISTIGYYRTKAEGLQALAAFNDNPYDLVMSKTTFKDIYEMWSKDRFNEKTNISTRRNYEAAYKACSKLYDMKMSDIRGYHLQKVLDNWDKGYESCKRIRILFNQLYKWCMEKELVQKNYAEYLKVPKPEEVNERMSFSTEEIQKLWDNVDQNEYVPIVLILIYSGVRISELLNLEKSNVNLEEQWFKVVESKTESGRNRIVPIADKVLPFWKDFFEKSTCKYVFCTVEGEQLKYDNFKKRYWIPLMSQLHFKHTTHETRHTCISQMVMKNCNQTIIKKIVGHKSIMNLTEKVYTHIEIKELLDAINMI